MRILLVHNYYTASGGEDTVFETELKLLQQHGHEVIVYHDTNSRIAFDSKIRAVAETFWSSRSYNAIAELVSTYRPHIAHFHNTFSRVSPSAYYACRDHGVPIVQTIHNYRLLCPAATMLRDGHVCEDCLGRTFPWPAVKFRCYHGSAIHSAVLGGMIASHRVIGTWEHMIDRYILLTNFAREKFIAAGFPSNRLSVKPNIVYPDPGSKCGIGDYALFVGRLSPEKGVMTLLEAWRDHRLTQVPLWIVGDGPLRTQMAQYVTQHRLSQVMLVGQWSRTMTLDAMKSAQFLVLPSEWYEGYPATLAEAMGCALPSIVSDIGSLSEIIRHDHNGLHFEVGNALKLADMVAFVWNNEPILMRLGSSARNDYEVLYDSETNYRVLYSIYEKTIESARS